MRQSIPPSKNMMLDVCAQLKENISIYKCGVERYQVTRHMCVLADAEFFFKTQNFTTNGRAMKTVFQVGGLFPTLGQQAYTLQYTVCPSFSNVLMTLGTSCINKFTKWGVPMPPACVIHYNRYDCV